MRRTQIPLFTRTTARLRCFVTAERASKIQTVARARLKSVQVALEVRSKTEGL